MIVRWIPEEGFVISALLLLRGLTNELEMMERRGYSRRVIGLKWRSGLIQSGKLIQEHLSEKEEKKNMEREEK